MPEYLRVRDKDTGHEYTIHADHLNEEAHTVLKKPALDNHGEPAAMKPRVPIKKAASRGTKNPAPAIEPEQEDSGRQAGSDKENS